MFNALSKKLSLLSLVIGAAAFVTTSANAALVVTNSDIVVTGEGENISQSLDLNGDGYDDVEFAVFQFLFESANGLELGESAGIAGLETSVEYDGGSYSTYTSFFASAFDSLINFSNGSSVGTALPIPVLPPSEFFAESEYDGDYYDGDYYDGGYEPDEFLISEPFMVTDAFLYDTSPFLSGDDFPLSDFLIPNEGDTAFIGYQLTQTFFPSDGSEGEMLDFVGFIEVTHGSIKVGRVGFQNDPSMPAIIPTGEVSAPAAASMMLLAIGAMLFGRKFRK